MPDTINHLNLWTLKKAIQKTLKGIIKTDRSATAEIIAHLSNPRSFNKKYFHEFEVFYNSSDKHKLYFFKTISQLEQYMLFSIFNKIYAMTDTPRWLLNLRKDLRNFLKSDTGSLKIQLKKIDALFRHYLDNIFNYQYLILNVHNADNTPINLLKFISEKEGVHPATHFSKFVTRLNAPDRIILSLSHFKLPDSPAVYIEIALSREIIRDISSILGENRIIEEVSKCRSAMFYSVNKCMAGLDSVGLGEKMILKSVEYIQKTYPKIKNFVTLSPIPSFNRYLAALIGDKETLTVTLTSILKKEILNASSMDKIIDYCSKKFEYKIEDLRSLLEFLINNETWYEDKNLHSLIAPIIFELCKIFLLQEKVQVADRLAAYDPVENFHLNNGAQLKYINPFANRSKKGFHESLGTMVNYLYDLNSIEKNQVLYHSGTIVHHL